MKTPLLLLFAALLAFASCETLEDNSPAMQGTVDTVFFKAGDVLGKRVQFGRTTIQGVTQDEVLTLHTRFANVDSYPLGPGELNYATFQNFEGVIYTTDTPGGSGEINITSGEFRPGHITGDFKFTAISSFGDTLVVSNGFFFEANYKQDNLIGEEPNADENSLTASVNGTGFNPTQVTVNTTQGVVTTEATAANQTIIIQVPDNALPGAYNIGDVGYAAGYRVDGGTIIAQSGNITVVSNDTAARMMVIDFSFVAGEYEVTAGSMTIYY